MLTIAAIVVLSYLAGSIPGSLWVGKLTHGIDVRRHGSGNMGATNTFRVLGWRAGVLATIVDVGKGLLAAGVIAKLRLNPEVVELPFWNPDVFYQMVAGASAILGHMFPVFAGFRGGKGMNTAAGVLFAITPYSMWITLAVFVTVLGTSRYVSLASMAAAIAFPVTVALRKYVFGIERLDASIVVISIVIMVGLIYAHRSNIGRLLEGTESRVQNFRPARGMAGRGEL